jgi:hypothetical protein
VILWFILSESSEYEELKDLILQSLFRFLTYNLAILDMFVTALEIFLDLVMAILFYRLYLFFLNLKINKLDAMGEHLTTFNKVIIF